MNCRDDRINWNQSKAVSLAYEQALHLGQAKPPTRKCARVRGNFRLEMKIYQRSPPGTFQLLCDFSRLSHKWSRLQAADDGQLIDLHFWICSPRQFECEQNNLVWPELLFKLLQPYLIYMTCTHYKRTMVLSLYGHDTYKYNNNYYNNHIWCTLGKWKDDYSRIIKRTIPTAITAKGTHVFRNPPKLKVKINNNILRILYKKVFHY